MATALAESTRSGGLESAVETAYPNADLGGIKKNAATVTAVGAPPPKP